MLSSLLSFLSLSDPNVRFVVLGMVLLGASAGAVGCFTLLRKRALLGDAVAHAVLPGICVAFMLSGTKNIAVLMAGAVASGWLSLWAIDLITRRSRIKADTATGLVLSVFFGIGILLLTVIQRSGNASQSGLDKFLLGKAAAMTGTDVQLLAVVCALLLGTIAVFLRGFWLISFDPNFARAIGMPTRSLELLLATITVVDVAVGIQAVGVVLMAALLLTPAAAARYLTDRLVLMLFLAMSIGALSGVGGAYISYIAPAMPTGPWVVVVLSSIAALCVFFAPRKGLAARWWQHRRNRRQMLEENVLKIFYQLGEAKNDFFAPRPIDALQQRRALPQQHLQQGLKRLVARDYIRQQPEGWVLTDTGKQNAQRLVRVHRLWEVYLSRYHHLAPDHVHDNADAVEHLISPDLEQQLETMLNYPQADPHNNPIPYKKT